MDREGPIAISSCLNLKKGHLIPNFPYKLLSIIRLTKELNCTVLMTAHGCVVQDTQTQKIICYGTESGGLYYLDNVGLALKGELAKYEGVFKASLVRSSRDQT